MEDRMEDETGYNGGENSGRSRGWKMDDIKINIAQIKTNDH